MIRETASRLLEKIRRERPIIHTITNAVTMNDCANFLLALGASPIMADSPQEAAEITEQCQGLVLNIGTPSQERFLAMARAGARANALGHPVVLDPVGIGASSFRRRETKRLLREVQVSLIRGNFSEIAALAGLAAGERGVDSGWADREENCIELAKSVSQSYGCAVLLTGRRDIATFRGQVVLIGGGHRDMARITGAGCMLSAAAGAFAAVCQGDYFRAAWEAALTMKACGAYAAERCQGTGTMRLYLMDRASTMTTLDGGDEIEFER